MTNEARAHNCRYKTSKQQPIQTKRIQTNKMGQTQSAEELSGIENSQISNRIKPKLKLANQIGQNLLTANYLDDEFLQKIISVVKNLTKGKKQKRINHGNGKTNMIKQSKK